MLWQPSNKLPSGWWLGDALRSDCMMLKPHAALHSHFRRTSVLFKSFINRVLLLLIANKVASNLEIYFNCEDLDLEWTCHVSIDPLTVQCWNQLSFGKCRCGTKSVWIYLSNVLSCCCSCTFAAVLYLVISETRAFCAKKQESKNVTYLMWCSQDNTLLRNSFKIQTPSNSYTNPLLYYIFSSSEKWEYHQWCLIMVPTSRRLPWASSQYAPSPNFPVMASGGKLSTLCLGRSDKIIPRKIFPIMFFSAQESP